MRRGESEGLGLTLLHADVAGAGVIVANQNGGKARRDAASFELGSTLGDVSEYGLGDGTAGEQARGVFGRIRGGG
jgi:hypothetical protein